MKNDEFQKLKKTCSDMYSEWVIQNWLRTGGLISPGMAAKMLNVSMTRINQIWTDRKFERLSHPFAKNKTLLKFTDLVKILEERKKSKLTVTNETFKLSIESLEEDQNQYPTSDKLKKMLLILEETKKHIIQNIENLEN